ncbi:hypothetical protein BJP25_08265 [Actinokineospora bangkokensis]|uniref:HTH tetR-type domain-containing protein n=2 Tax=Actinokineospora bangkokensis TaxID=1193682 RepID=A0A1Q9LSG3_9PSEU|nr:hypothetical protein BJP25_08265 [Actinokineospora bangkokensis]
MGPEERRRMVVAAALPLLAEFGPTVTTARVARAAGIGEATIFRVFADKDALLRACAAEVVRPDGLLGELGAIDRDLPVEQRLAEAATALSARQARIDAVVGPLAGALRGGPGSREALADGRERARRLITEALVELLEPDVERFRLPLEEVAGAFGLMALALGRQGEVAEPTLVVDLFLHGTLKPV